MDLAGTMFSNRFDSTTCTLYEPKETILYLLLVGQISLRQTLQGFKHRFGHELGVKSKS